jgi:hypothetical protein
MMISPIPLQGHAAAAAVPPPLNLLHSTSRRVTNTVVAQAGVGILYLEWTIMTSKAKKKMQRKMIGYAK